MKPMRLNNGKHNYTQCSRRMISGQNARKVVKVRANISGVIPSTLTKFIRDSLDPPRQKVPVVGWAISVSVFDGDIELRLLGWADVAGPSSRSLRAEMELLERVNILHPCLRFPQCEDQKGSMRRGPLPVDPLPPEGEVASKTSRLPAEPGAHPRSQGGRLNWASSNLPKSPKYHP